MQRDSVGPSRVTPGWRVPPFGIAAILLVIAHIALLTLLRHSGALEFWSDIFMVVLALFAAGACFLTGHRSRGIARPFWYLVGTAFATWFLAACLRFFENYCLKLSTFGIVPVLMFFLSAAPMFVAVILSDEDFRDTINWEWILDATQILGLILIIYLFIVYVPLLTPATRWCAPSRTSCSCGATSCWQRDCWRVGS
jgi:hypothetical protein